MGQVHWTIALQRHEPFTNGHLELPFESHIYTHKHLSIHTNMYMFTHLHKDTV